MSKDKTKSEKLAGKLLEIAVNSIDLYYEDEAKQIRVCWFLRWMGKWEIK